MTTFKHKARYEPSTNTFGKLFTSKSAHHSKASKIWNVCSPLRNRLKSTGVRLKNDAKRKKKTFGYAVERY